METCLKFVHLHIDFHFTTCYPDHEISLQIWKYDRKKISLSYLGVINGFISNQLSFVSYI